MMKVIGYARVSTSKQATFGVSISAQIERISTYAASNNLPVHKVVVSINSGKKSIMCGELDDAMKVMKNCHVIIYDVSRLSRNPIDCMAFIKAHVDNGAKFTFITEGITIHSENYATVSEDVNRYLLAAQEEIRQLSRRIKMSKEYKKNNGAYIGGMLPYGLEVYMDHDGERMCRPDKYEMDVVKFIDKCRSASYTADELNRLMKPITQFNMQQHKICLYENVGGVEVERENNNAPVSNQDIAALLNEYNVKYRSKPFTAQIVKRIRSEENLKQYYAGNADTVVANLEQIVTFDPNMDSDSEMPNLKRRRIV